MVDDSEIYSYFLYLRSTIHTFILMFLILVLFSLH